MNVLRLRQNRPSVSRSAIYAIGDVHGEAERLKRLHSLILQRHASRWPDLKMKIVHLGDYVDRGPDSYAVIDAIIALEQRGVSEIINLKGNHEQMLLDAINGQSMRAMRNWLHNGGDKTLKSYTSRGFTDIDTAHIVWLKNLLNLHVDVTQKIIFVHAGIDPEAYPHCGEDVYMWTRSPRFFDVNSWGNAHLEGWRVVHGHTPTADFFPETEGKYAQRINIDTGAVFGGRLTAAVFVASEDVSYIYA